jgi:hypothetical protein
MTIWQFVPCHRLVRKVSMSAQRLFAPAQHAFSEACSHLQIHEEASLR